MTGAKQGANTSYTQTFPNQSESTVKDPIRRKHTVAPLFLVFLVGACGAPSLPAAEIVPLGHIPGLNFSMGLNISDDGQVVSGYSGIWDNGNLASPPYEMFRWTAETGVVPLGMLEGFDRMSEPRGNSMSADGQKLVAIFIDPLGPGESGTPWVPALWEEGVGWGRLPMEDVDSRIFLSADGEVVVGSFSSERSDSAFRWTEQDGVEELGVLPGGSYSRPRYHIPISADASIVTGLGNQQVIQEDGSLFFPDRQFIWDSESGIRELVIDGIETEDDRQVLFAISRDGEVMAGVGILEGESERQLFRWTGETGAVGLGNMLGSEATGSTHAMSGDGSLITAGFGPALTSERIVGIWSDRYGLEDFQQALVDRHGLSESLMEWDLQNVFAISPNGRFFTGLAINPNGDAEAYLVRLDRHFAVVPEPSSLVLISLAAIPILQFTTRIRRRQV